MTQNKRERLRNMLINFTQEISSLSECKDKKTAAILLSENLMQVYSIGVNGGPKGGKNCLCDRYAKEKYTCTHAEMNCLVKNSAIDNRPKIMICTKQPCQMCATLIVNADTNIKEVYFIEPFHDNTGIDILVDAGIKVYELRFNEEATE